MNMEKHFVYLDALRKSGATNMFGAAPYLAEAFDMPIKEARVVLQKWASTFDPEKVSAERAKEAAGQ